MNKFSFSVDIVAGDIDRDAVRAALEDCVNANLTDSTGFASVRTGPVKALSHQGYLVSRARVAGVTVEKAGDGANPKVKADA
jgi:hypothetical protein